MDLVYTGILIVSLLFLVWKKEETESYFPLKILGYFILGSFAFNFNQISIPLGFIVYLLFFRPTLNVRVKRIASILGVLSFILVHWILPTSIHAWESRPTHIEHELGSIYKVNFQEEYKLVKDELKLEEQNVRLEDFNVEYVRDGRVQELRWQLLVQNGSGYHLYQIQYDMEHSRYRVTNSQLDTWHQYNRLIDADQYFENLNFLDIKDITHAKGDFSSYVIQSSGERNHYAREDQSHFFVTNGEIQSLDDEQLPVEGYYISTFAMKKMDEKRDKKGNITEESFEGTESTNYIFDVTFGEER